MKGVVFAEFGGHEVLTYGELPDPPVHAGEVKVDVRAIGVNPSDVAVRAGYLQTVWPHFPPIVPGFDVAGVVAEVPPGVQHLAPGDGVLALNLKDYVRHGTYGELTSIPLRLVARKPDSLSWETAGALPTSGLAALQSLRAVGVGEGDTVLVHSGAGGVGHLAIQLAQRLGAARVIATASDANHEFVESLGAVAVTYGDGLAERIVESVGGDGTVDAVLDPFGGESLDASFRLARDASRVVCLTPWGVLERGGTVFGVTPNVEDLEYLAGLVVSGDLHLEVQQTLPLEQAAEAHQLIEGRHVRGKLVLTP